AGGTTLGGSDPEPTRFGAVTSKTYLPPASGPGVKVVYPLHWNDRRRPPLPCTLSAAQPLELNAILYVVPGLNVVHQMSFTLVSQSTRDATAPPRSFLPGAISRGCAASVRSVKSPGDDPLRCPTTTR